MCGILLSNVGKIKNNFLALKDSSYRGPDNTTLKQINDFYFGFNYLSITGKPLSASQPYIKNNNILLFNGEIYNFEELKKLLLKKFQQKNFSDTEVLSELFSQYGFENIINKLEGMWAIVYYDDSLKSYYISRDRIGIKPLFYYKKKGEIVIASDLKSISSIISSKKIDTKSAKKFLKTGNLNISSKTFYKEINVFPPAKYAKILAKNNRIFFYKYWKCENKELLNSKDIPHLKTLIKKQFSKHLNYKFKRKVGIPLSSGFDSNFIYNSFKNYKKIICYTLTNEKNNEIELLKNIYKKKIKNKSILIKEVNCNEANHVKFINEYVSKIDQPIRSFQHVYQYLLRKKAKADGIKILLSGDGADEVFAGYKYCIPYYLNSIGKSKFPKQKKDKSVKKISKLNLKNFLDKRIFKTHIPYWLHMDDLNSMLNSIENRVPFLDHKIIETVKKFKTVLLMKNNQTKYLLKKIYSEKLLKKLPLRKFHKPGNSMLIFNELSKDFKLNISKKKFNKFFNFKKVYNEYCKEKNAKIFDNSDKWYRYYFFVKWVNLNKIEI